MSGVHLWRMGIMTACLIILMGVPAIAETETLEIMQEPVMTVPAPNETQAVPKPGLAPMPMPDRTGVGQDYVEPGVTPEMSREEALEIAKEVLGTYAGLEFDQKEYQIGTEYRRDWQSPESYVWSVHLHYSDPGEYVSANVTLEASTGKVLDLNHDSGHYTDSGRKPLSLTKDEARERAEALIRRLAPGKLEQSRSVPTQNYYGYGSTSVYHFQYLGEVKGIPYDANFINISIDGTSGGLRNFNHRWDEKAELPSAEGIISRSEAASIFDEFTDVELFYLPMRDEFRYEEIPENFRIAYRMNQGMVGMIDAHSGKPVDWSGKEEWQEMIRTDISDERKSEILENAQKPSIRQQALTQQEAEALAHQLAEEISGKTVRINASQYSEGDGYWESAGRKIWNMGFTVEMDDVAVKGRIILDAETGELIAYNYWHYSYPPEEKEETLIGWEVGYEEAIGLIHQYHPYLMDEIKTEQRMIEYPQHPEFAEWISPEYNYQFPRKIGDALYDENSIMVSIDRYTGQIQNYTVRWTPELTLPSQENIISADQALDRLLEQFEIELAYNRINTSTDYMEPEYSRRLVYRWRPIDPSYPMNYVDAKDGTPLDYSGRSIPGRDIEAFEAVISGHWVERTAKLLAQQGVIEMEGFKPEEEITRIEAVKMMVKVRETDYYRGYGMEGAEDVRFVDVMEQDEDFRYIQWAIRYGIIENKPEAFQRDETLPREEMAQMMINLLGYGKLSKSADIFTVNYEDAEVISKENWGAVAISKGLGLVSPDQNNFRPKEASTMAETADMLYKASGLL